MYVSVRQEQSFDYVRIMLHRLSKMVKVLIVMCVRRHKKVNVIKSLLMYCVRTILFTIQQMYNF